MSESRKLLVGNGSVSHEAAMKKAKAEYKKYQEISLSPVEEAYMKTLNDANKLAKKEAQKKV